jgi:excisionase family DNA binding protein
MRTPELMTVREAAERLHTSRQHVLDLCARGLLPYVIVGAQRRLRTADVEALISPALTREQVEQLWLHHAIAGKLVSNPAPVLAAAAINLRRLRRMHPDGVLGACLEQWQRVLDEGPQAVLDALTSSTDYAVRLRGTSPFAGILSEMERRAVLTSLVESRHDRARPVPMATLVRVMRAV